MRWTMMMLGAAALAGCGGKDQGEATANADTGMTAEAITANDVTAIDAVTGAAANIAADVDYRDLGNADGNGSGNAASDGRETKPRSSSRSSAAPAPANDTAAQPATAEPANTSE